MTPEELLARKFFLENKMTIFCGRLGASAMEHELSKVITEAIQAERQACAKIAEEKKNFLVSVNDGIVTIPNLGGQIAKAIRARSGEKSD